MKATTSSTTALLALAERVSEQATGTRWYLFGSSLRDAARPNDLDPLIVYEDGQINRALELRDCLLVADTPRPLDVLLLSASEAASTGFVDLEACVGIWPADPSTTIEAMAGSNRCRSNRRTAK